MPPHPSCYHVSYSLSCAEYDDLLSTAKGRCQICKTPLERLSIDHDHSLGSWAVRGLVCHPCNQYLKVVDAGTAEPSVDAALYLANAWHKRQASSTAKQARVRPQTECPACGRTTSVMSNGRLHRHWSRIPGLHTKICPGVAPDDQVQASILRAVTGE